MMEHVLVLFPHHYWLCLDPPGYRLNDGYWHSVDLAARDNLLTLTIDEEEASPLKITNPFTIRTGDRYFFGGHLTIKLTLSNSYRPKTGHLFSKSNFFSDPQVVQKLTTRFGSVRQSWIASMAACSTFSLTTSSLILTLFCSGSGDDMLSFCWVPVGSLIGRQFNLTIEQLQKAKP